MSADDQTSGERWLDMTNAAYDKVTGFLLQVAEPERRAGIRGRAGHGRDDPGRQPRRRGEDRLLEVRALERVRLIEDGERLE